MAETETDSPAKVVNLMEALRKSLDQVSTKKKKPVKTPAKRGAKTAAKRTSRVAADAEDMAATAAPVSPAQARVSRR